MIFTNNEVYTLLNLGFGIEAFRPAKPAVFHLESEECTLRKFGVILSICLDEYDSEQY